jgi:hypothetical protein
MSEQERPFEENAIAQEMEYAIWEQEESTIFPAYRNDEKLIPRQKPRQGNLPLALIPVVIILAFLLFSYVAGYAFYAHTSFSSWHQNGQFYDRDHFDHHQFPQQKFDQPNQLNQPSQPNQTIPAGQPAPIIPSGTMPRIIIHHATGPGR